MQKNRKEEMIRLLDTKFKTVVHDSGILAVMLRSGLDEFRDSSIEEIKACLEIDEDGESVIGRETEYFSPKNGSVITDSVFRVRIPGTDENVTLIVNLEGQNDPNPGYPIGKRAEYYLARMVSSQKNVDFVKSNYGDLKKTYSIWYILNPKKDDRNTVYRYTMKPETVYGNQEGQPPELGTFNIILINIGRYDSSLPDILALPAALFSMSDDVECEEMVEKRFNIRLPRAIKEELKDMSVGEDTWNWAYREGTASGIEMVAVDGVINLMANYGMTMDEALSQLPIPQENIDGVVNEIKRRLGNGN